jgi:hypothetical protein
MSLLLLGKQVGTATHEAARPLDNACRKESSWRTPNASDGLEDDIRWNVTLLAVG